MGQISPLMWQNTVGVCSRNLIAQSMILKPEQEVTFWSIAFVFLLQKKFMLLKGQLISKCPNEKSVSSKIPMKTLLGILPGSLLLQG